MDWPGGCPRRGRRIGSALEPRGSGGGVYARDDDGRPQFHPLPAPEDADVAVIAADLARRIPALLERRGLGPQSDPEQADPLAQDQPLLADLYNASVLGRIATGANAGQRVRTRGDRIDGDYAEVLTGPRCASVAGFSLHANVAIPANDRLRLERLCRYVARPPLANERLSELPNGCLTYRLKNPWRNGTTLVPGLAGLERAVAILVKT